MEALSRKGFLNALILEDPSRKESLATMVSVPSNPILELAREEASKDSKYQQMLKEVLAKETDPRLKTKYQDYLVDEGLIYFKKRLCVPSSQALKRKILWEAHDSPFSGHPGYAKTLNAIRKSYHWENLKGNVLKHVTECLSCQWIKAEHVKLRGKLQPLEIPQMKWEFISMDFVVGLPLVQGGYNSIIVIVDMLTKVAHLIPVKTNYKESDVARLFIKEIFRLHGLPKRIIIDRDSLFTSHFWKSLFQAIETQLCFSTAYHPQSDGQTERVNQVIEDILRAYCCREPK